MSKEYRDYSMMLSQTKAWSDKEFNDTIEEYENAKAQAEIKSKETRDKYEFFARNVEGLKYMREQRYKEKLKKNFKLKKEHLLLLSEMHFENYEKGGDLVFLGVNGKRPFGESNIEGSIKRILEMFYCDDDGFGKQEKYVKKLLDELPMAIEYLIKQAKIK